MFHFVLFFSPAAPSLSPSPQRLDREHLKIQPQAISCLYPCVLVTSSSVEFKLFPNEISHLYCFPDCEVMCSTVHYLHLDVHLASQIEGAPHWTGQFFTQRHTVFQAAIVYDVGNSKVLTGISLFPFWLWALISYAVSSRSKDFNI